MLNTNIATVAALLTVLDVFSFGLPSVLGAVNGMIGGLVATTTAAGYMNGSEAIVLGSFARFVPWLTWNKPGTTAFMSKVDDTLGVIHTHGVAVLVGGIGVGIHADPKMIEFLGTGKDSNVSITGVLFGNPH